MKHAQRIVKSKLQDHPSLLPSNISSTAFDTLISFCLDNSFFEYNNKFFAQNSGSPMGSPLTVELAEIGKNDQKLARLSNHLSFFYCKLLPSPSYSIICGTMVNAIHTIIL